MKVFSEDTRKRMSQSAKLRAARPDFLSRVRSYWKPICSHDELVRMYVTENMSQTEIAETLEVSLKRVQTSMRRYGITPRKAVKRNQTGECNSSWHGSNCTYAGFHNRIGKLKGHPQKCEVCGTSDPNRFYDWANLTGRYDDPDDYKRMCRSCHWKLHKTSRNFKGANGHHRAPKEVSNA